MWVNIVVLVLASLLLAAMLRARWRAHSFAKYDGPRLAAIIKEAERAITDLVRPHCPDARVFSFGATYLDPRHLAIWIATTTDAERDALRGSKALRRKLRAALRAAGYPRAAISRVAFGFESQETVRRDHKGSWYLALK